jgi:hypothetical protein
MRNRTALIASTLLVVTAAPAAAQNAPGTDLAVGAIGYRNLDAAMSGWNVQWSRPIDWRWGAVVEITGARGTNAEPGGYRFDDFAGLGGVRCTWAPAFARATAGRPPRLTAFWQVLGGGVIRERSGQSCDPAGRCSADDSSTLVGAVQPGAGLVWMFHQRVGVRAQADLQTVFLAGQAAGFPRAAVGAIVRLGS